MPNEKNPVKFKETAVLEKFVGNDRTPENLIERITLVNGVIVSVEGGPATENMYGKIKEEEVE